MKFNEQKILPFFTQPKIEDLTEKDNEAFEVRPRWELKYEDIFMEDLLDRISYLYKDVDNMRVSEDGIVEQLEYYFVS